MPKYIPVTVTRFFVSFTIAVGIPIFCLTVFEDFVSSPDLQTLIRRLFVFYWALAAGFFIGRYTNLYEKRNSSEG